MTDGFEGTSEFEPQVRPVPEQLTAITSDVVEDFARLWPQLSHRSLTETQIEEYLRHAVASPETAVFVIRDEDSRIQATQTGYIGHTPYAHKAWVDEVVTDERYRGRGFGDALMDTLIDWFEANGADSATLTSNSSREAAGRLYERKGFGQRDTRVFKRSFTDNSYI